MSGRFQIDLDIVLEETRNAMNRVCVQGVAREELLRRNIDSKILKEFGPAGGNPLVRLTGSRVALEDFIREIYTDETTDPPEFFIEMIKPYEPARPF